MAQPDAFFASELRFSVGEDATSARSCNFIYAFSSGSGGGCASAPAGTAVLTNGLRTVAISEHGAAALTPHMFVFRWRNRWKMTLHWCGVVRLEWTARQALKTRNPSMLFRSPEATGDCSSRRALDDYARIVDVDFICHLLLWLFEALGPDSCDFDLTRPRATLSLLLSIWLSRRC